MKKILFVCVENAGRSQMAEAFFKKYIPLGFQPTSAGTKPAARVNPIVIQVMKEVGIDIKNNSPQNISQQMIEESEIAINMGCVDEKSCPALFLRDVDGWQIQDPKGKSIGEVREIRDQIEHKVKDCIVSITKDGSI